MDAVNIFTRLSGDHSASPQMQEKRTAGLDVAALRAALAPSPQTQKGSSQITFNLFDDLVLTLQTVLVEPFGADGIVWRGQLAGVCNVRGYLAVSGIRNSSKDHILVVSGCVFHDKDIYSIKVAGENTVYIERVSNLGVECQQPPCSETHQHIHEVVNIGSAEDEPDFEADENTVDTTDEVAEIHILALYPTGAKKGISGGEQAIETWMALAQTYTNEAFHNSGIPAHVSVTVQELPDLPHANLHTLRQVVAIERDSLPSKAVSAAREKAKASVVALLTDIVLTEHAGGGLWGVAATVPLPPRSDRADLSQATFAMTLNDPARVMATFAHEFGHLLGGQHDRITEPRLGPNQEALYDYVRGYVPPDKSFVTIMGYERSSIHYVTAYSAADKKWNGVPLGIPMGMPDAADAAKFFRLSTRIVASYVAALYGVNAPHWVPVNLELLVFPFEGGTVVPGMLGPYPKDSRVKVTAIPRAGYKFSHWLLDGADNGKTPAIEVAMTGTSHNLIALFTQGEEQYTVSVEPPPGDLRLFITLDPRGGKYHPDTNVALQLNGAEDIELDQLIDQWLIDDQPAGNSRRIVVNISKNIKVTVRLKNTTEFIQLTGGFLSKNLDKSQQKDMLPVNSTAVFQARVYKTGLIPAANELVVFSLKNMPEGSKIISDAKVRTDHDGYANVTLQTGKVPGLKGEIVAALENSSTRPQSISIGVLQRALVPISPLDYHILSSDSSPMSIRAQVQDLGVPATKGIPVHFALDYRGGGHKAKPMITPIVETDEHGIAVAKLEFTRGGDADGEFGIIASVPDAYSRDFLSAHLHFNIRFVSK